MQTFSRSALLSAMALILLSTGLDAQARSGPMGERGMMGAQLLTNPIERILEHAEALELTAEQRTRLTTALEQERNRTAEARAVYEAHRAEMEPRRTEMREAMEERREAMREQMEAHRQERRRGAMRERGMQGRRAGFRAGVAMGMGAMMEMPEEVREAVQVLREARAETMVAVRETLTVAQMSELRREVGGEGPRMRGPMNRR